MGLLIQVSPFNDSVVSTYSATYKGKLITTGNTGAVTYITTSPSGSVTVDSSGDVTTNSLLAEGVYIVGGTMVDTLANVGVWSFTLTVSPVSPETSVVPVNPSLPSPSGVEIQLPFHIDPATGGVAQTLDYSQILANHIETIIMTSTRTRLMLPNYGGDLENAVFADSAQGEYLELISDMQDAIAAWEPSVLVQSIAINPQNAGGTALTVTLEFTIVPFSDVNTISVTTGGTITQVGSP